jgi:hypothetical protein
MLKAATPHPGDVMDETPDKIFRTTISFTLLGIMVMLIGIYYQMDKVNDFNRANLADKKEDEVFQWEKDHPEAKAWIFNPDTSLKQNYERWNFDDYLGIYEDVYSLSQKNLIDPKLSYDFFSYTLETIYEANNFELKRMIDSFRVADNDPDIFIGVEGLYKQYKSQRRTLTANH